MKEDRFTEYKSAITNTFLKTVSAFANFGDGKILFGVADDGTTVGVEDPSAACLAIENRINDSIQPRPDFRLELNRKTKVVSLYVYEGADKPYLYHGKAFRRSDTATVEVDRVELQRLTLIGTGKYYDQLPSKMTVPSFTILEAALREKLGIKEITQDILKTLNLYSEQTGYNHAAELFADTNTCPGIDIVRFGRNISEIRDRKRLLGQSILRQYDESLQIFQTYYQYEAIQGAARVNKESVPKEAFREAVANALVHRTWDVSANIRVAMYADRIEVYSPGGLPFGLRKEEYIKGYQSVLRNPIVANLFFRLNIIEMFGTGIKRILDVYRPFDVKPAFDITDSAVAIVLPSTESARHVTAEQRAILDLFSGGQVLSRAEISSGCGLARDKTIRLINTLLEKGYLKKEGRGRGTKYSV